MSNLWPTKTLGELCEKPQYGFTASASLEPVGPRFLRITDLRDGTLDWKSVPFCQCSKNEQEKFRLYNGDIVVARIGATTGRASLILNPPESVFASYLIRLRANEALNPVFLFFFTQSQSYRSWIDGNKENNLKGGVNAAVLTQIQVPVPPKPEQKKIAAVLWKIQRAIETEEKLIVTARELKQSAMRQLFTRGLGSKPQKETDIGPIPDNWTLVPASEIFKLTSGDKRPANLSPVATADKPFPVLGGNGVMGFSKEWFLDTKECLVIGRVGEYCGAIHLAHGKVWITDNALYAKEWLRDDVRVDFLAAYLDYYDLNRFKRKAGQPLVTQGLINEHNFPVPSPDEQHDIATILQTINRKISVHERKRTTLHELCKSMLHELMTGEIRVADLDIDASEIES